MNARQALQHLSDAVALWAADAGNATDVIDAACVCLVTGLDTPTLQILAGAPTAHASEELSYWLDDTLSELGLPNYARHSPEAREAATRVMARKLLAGGITPSELTSWAHQVIGHDASPLLDELVCLDDVFGCLDYSEETEEDVNARVMVEARRILSADPAAGSTRPDSQ